MAAEQGPEQRGVHNPRVVDLIRPAGEGGGVELLMLETRPWGSDPQQLAQLEAKLNAYLGYVQTGALARDYPQYAGGSVRFRLECAAAPGDDAARMLTAMREFCARDGVEFVVAPIAGDGPGPAPQAERAASRRRAKSSD